MGKFTEEFQILNHGLRAEKALVDAPMPNLGKLQVLCNVNRAWAHYLEEALISFEPAIRAKAAELAKADMDAALELLK